MADCHSLFTAFHERIRLPTSKEDYLRASRDALRQKIEKHFVETLGVSRPAFHIQGSYAMRTLVNPVCGEYDIDDGVYLTHIPELPEDVSEWPLTPTEAHELVVAAVREQTSVPTLNKEKCVRVVYANDYHVDLPIYLEYEGNPYLADTGSKGWHVNNAKALVKWFRNEIGESGEQLARVVRYLKAWVDHNSDGRDMPSGLILTVLAVVNYKGATRDDVAFSDSIGMIANQLEQTLSVANPVDDSEDLAMGHENEMDVFAEHLAGLKTDSDAAVGTESQRQACELWRAQFGERFPSCSSLPDSELPKKTKKPALLRDDFRAA